MKFVDILVRGSLLIVLSLIIQMVAGQFGFNQTERILIGALAITPFTSIIFNR